MKKRTSFAEPLESRIAPATFTVSTALDSGPGSFRQAILDANGAAGPDGIVFSFPGGSYTVIQPLSPLPALLGEVSIDGLIAGPDYQLPHVFLDGSLAGAGASGLTISGDGVTVQRLAIGNFSAHGVRINGSGNYLAHNHIGTDFAGAAAAGNGGDGVIVESGSGNSIGVGLLHPNLISGNGGAGVHLAFGSTATTVSGNKIGLNLSGTAAIPNLNGVVIDGDSAGNIIGGTERNIISGNTDYGVKVNSTASGSTSAPTQFIQANYIGTGMSGSGDFGNGKSGVYLLSTMAVRLDGNVISGNGTNGVEINSGSRHQLYGNTIGLDSAGAAAIANTQTGVYVNGANLNIIGGQAAGAGNVISGNGLHGVNVLAGGSGNTVLGNLIGTDKTGAVAIGNTGDGVRLQSVINTTIGGAGTNAGNVISGNGGDGVFVSGGTSAAGTTLKQNYIGTTSAGTGDLGNGGNGVQFSSVLGTSTIGGSGSGSGNVIAGNGLSGILVGSADLLTIQGNVIGRADAPNARGVLINGSAGNGILVGGISAGQGNNIGFNTGAGVAATGNANAGIRGNSIHDNGGLGIDLGNNGATANDPLDADSGANELLNFPALDSAIISAGSTQVSGTYAGLPDTALTIDFYSNTANGEAETYLGSTTVTTDSLGAAGFAATLPAVPAGRTISATANRVGSPLQTSEISAQIAPQAALTISDVTLTEGASNFTFTISLSAASAGTVSVDYATADGTAIAGSDYSSMAGTISFAAGETSKTISVPVIGDTTPEFTETFFVNLSNPNGATISDAQAIGTITNDDIPFLSIGDITALESGAFTFSVTLSQAHVLPVTFDFATVGGSALEGADFTGASGQITIPAGETSAQITILVADENIVEGDETFNVTLSASQNATIGDGTALATILNNDETYLVVESVLIPEGDFGTTSAVFVVNLTAPSASDVTFTFFTTDVTARAGSDYTTTTGSATIPAGATSTAISVPIIGDTLVGRDEYFNFEIENLAGAIPAALLAGGVILNDDEGPVMISIADSSAVEGNEGHTNLVFVVQLSGGLEYDISIGLMTANGTASSPGDFVAGPYVVTIPAEATTATVSVRVLADTVVEPDETLTVSLPQFFGENVIFSRSTATGTILNDDTAFSISGGSYSESGDYQFTVTRTGFLDAAVDLEYRTRAGTATADVDYATQIGPITFAPGETSITRSFPITQDSVIEIDEAFSVLLTLPGGLMHPPGLGPILNGTAQITIVDDDGPTVHVETTKSFGLEDGVDDAGRIAFSIILSGPSPLPISVHLRSVAGTATTADFGEIDEVVTFAPGQTVFESEVFIRSDRFAEADETLTLRISEPQYAALGADTVALSIRDNDGLVISKNRKTATWRDLDGDLVTLKVTKPVLTPALFGFRFGGPIAGAPGISGQLLESLDIAAAGNAANGMSLKFTAKLKDGLGDKFVNVGAIHALGVRLGSVVLPGDLGKIEAGNSGIPVESTRVGKTALKGLSIRSLGALGTSTQGALGHLQSFIAGKLGALKITGDFADAELTIAGGSGALTVGGNLRGGDGSGIHANGKIASVRILGDMLGDAPDDAVSLVTYAGKITIGGRVENADIRAGIVAALSVSKEWTASSFTALRIASIVIGREVNGTAVGGDSFQFVASQINSMKVAGSKLPLTKGIDNLTIGATLDVRVRETEI